MADAPSIPSHADLMWPTIKALRALGGSGSINEIVEKVVELEGFTEEQQAVPHGDGPQGQIEYRLAWARTYVKGMGCWTTALAGSGP
jgi:restriction system protein